MVGRGEAGQHPSVHRTALTIDSDSSQGGRGAKVRKPCVEVTPCSKNPALKGKSKQ